jgi:hypothetical protein
MKAVWAKLTPFSSLPHPPGHPEAGSSAQVSGVVMARESYGRSLIWGNMVLVDKRWMMWIWEVSGRQILTFKCSHHHPKDGQMKLEDKFL